MRDGYTWRPCPETGTLALVSVGASFALVMTAACRDCGAPIPDWERRLRGGAAPTGDELAGDGPSDLGGSEVHVTHPGACTACGGGRVSIRTELGFDAEDPEE